MVGIRLNGRSAAHVPESEQQSESLTRGSCYRVAGLLASPGAAHSAADRAYVGLTAAC